MNNDQISSTPKDPVLLAYTPPMLVNLDAATAEGGKSAGTGEGPLTSFPSISTGS